MRNTDNTAQFCSDCASAVYKTQYRDSLERSIGAAPSWTNGGSIQVRNEKSFKSPRQLYDLIDSYVSGQEDAKKAICIAVYNHMLRINAPEGVEIGRSNVLMIGPTGSGKTFLIQTLAKQCNIPMVIADVTGMTEAGYKGNNVENILTSLFLKARQNLSSAEKGIVYIDEIDKIAGCAGSDKDVSGRGVQKGLLKILEGSKIQVPTSFNQNPALVEMDTSNILFVLGGAFSALEREMVAKKSVKGIGFTNELRDVEVDKDELRKGITADDLINGGFMAEFIGRCPVITTLKSLKKQDLLDILTKKKNCLLKEYTDLFNLDGIQLNISQEALDLVVDDAIRREVGARGLRSSMEKLLKDAMFDRDRSIIEVGYDTAKQYFGESNA